MSRASQLFSVITLLFCARLVQAGENDDLKLYNRLGTVAGHVEIVNHPSLGRTPCRNCPFLLVHRGCKSCVVYVKTDADGDYKCRIAFGRWRAVMVEQRQGSSRVFDLLAPRQPRYFDVTNATNELRFDIETVVSSE
jgi:hypothetical protein